MVIFFYSVSWFWPLIKVLVGVFTVHLIFRGLFKMLHNQLEALNWRVVFLDKLYTPCKLFIWLIGASCVALFYRRSMGTMNLDGVMFSLIHLGFVSLLSWVMFLLVFEGKRILYRGKRCDRTAIEMLFKFVLIGLGFVSLLMVLQVFGIPVRGLLAFGGLSGVIVTLAMQKLLGDVFEGFLVAVDKPLHVGDRILSINKNELDGFVEKIGWRLTRIQQLDGRPIYMPNSLLPMTGFINDSEITHRGIYRKISIRYEDVDQMRAIIEDVKVYIRNLQKIDHTLLNMISFTEFGDKGLDLKLRLYLKTKKSAERNEQQEKILFDVYKIIDKHRALLARTPRFVYGKSLKQGR